MLLARERLDAAAREARDLSDGVLAPRALLDLALLARWTGDREQEESLLMEATVAAGPAPRLSLAIVLHIQKAEYLFARHDVYNAAELARDILTRLKGKASGNRMSLYTVLLLCADMELAREQGPRSLTRIARFLEAAQSVAERLGLAAPEPTARERITRIEAAMTEKLVQNRWAHEVALGAAVDDEAALALTLSE